MAYRKEESASNFGIWFGVLFVITVLACVLYVFWTQGVFEIHKP